MAEIDSLLKKLDWCDREGEGREGEGRREALLLCNGLISLIKIRVPPMGFLFFYLTYLSKYMTMSYNLRAS